MSIAAITESHTSSGPSRHHHGSHVKLLAEPERASRISPVDAIVVPTARHSLYLQTAIDLALKLGCPLVALCSKASSAQHTFRRARRAGIEIVAIDTDNVPVGLLPTFATSGLLAGTKFERRTDISLKRNLGLLLARRAGWERIVFLDDDITIPEPTDLGKAAGMLDSHDVAGLSIGGFPDNSVVCHAYRDAGGPQDSFIGGGALAINVAASTAFFPKIYNEDWFFLLNDTQLRTSAKVGLAIQQSYDPFANEQRARSEEFGDTLAEGVYWLLDHGRRVRDADADYWREFLHNRRHFIGEVIDMVTQADIDLKTKTRMIKALKAACGRNLLITPQVCVAYLRAWRTDRLRWQRHVETLCPQVAGVRMDPAKVLSDLGLMGCSQHSYQRTRRAS